MASKDLFIREDNCKLSWEYKGRLVTIECKCIISFQFYKKAKIILVLNDLGGNESIKLFGYEFDGNLKFKTTPPKGFTFSYLTEHPEIEVAVVGSSSEKIEGWYDWHFSINGKTGELKRWCPAM